MCLVVVLPVQSLLMHMFQKLSYLLCGLCLSLTLPRGSEGQVELTHKILFFLVGAQYSTLSCTVL